MGSRPKQHQRPYQYSILRTESKGFHVRAVNSLGYIIQGLFRVSHGKYEVGKTKIKFKKE